MNQNLSPIIPGEKVSNLDDVLESSPATLTTESGKTLEVDLVIKCTGLTVNTTAFKEGLGKFS